MNPKKNLAKMATALLLCLISATNSLCATNPFFDDTVRQLQFNECCFNDSSVALIYEIDILPIIRRNADSDDDAVVAVKVVPVDSGIPYPCYVEYTVWPCGSKKRRQTLVKLVANLSDEHLQYTTFCGNTVFVWRTPSVYLHTCGNTRLFDYIINISTNDNCFEMGYVIDKSVITHVFTETFECRWLLPPPYISDKYIQVIRRRP